MCDDDAEAGKQDKKGRKSKEKGQNTSRHFGSSRDALALCLSRAHTPEFAHGACQFGDACKYEHDLRKYLKEGKREDLTTFRNTCPIYEARGVCSAGWRCRFASAHSEEKVHDDGRKELVLMQDTTRASSAELVDGEEQAVGVVNIVSAMQKIDLRKRKVNTPKSDIYTEWLNKTRGRDNNKMCDDALIAAKDNAAQYTEPPLRPSEKRRIYYGPETPVLAPLTTQGNLPFRRLAVELGAQVTWSEMAMSLPLIQGEKSEWALMKAHESELTAPKYEPGNGIVQGYDNTKDIRFGAQIAGNKEWVTLKATEVLTALCPHLRAIDLNCGCPIDLVFRQGAGSALMDQPGKLEKILRGMNTVSGEIPITVKIRMGTKDGKPTAERLIDRLVFGGPEAKDAGLEPSGIAAVTLHGRSRQQRYTRSADWEYISACAATINKIRQRGDDLADTIHEVDARSQSASHNGQLYFVGNGDCYSHVDYYNHISHAKVDSVMVARGALIKPWIFEEIATGQYLDKSSTERLAYIEKFARYGLEAWGSDEIGLGITRRFLLEWLSFSCRYVPIGILEHLPPRIQDRPPQYRGRNDLETLLSSDNYKDWIKISEMFLGPAHPNFTFVPKHKSNAHGSMEDTAVEG